MERAFTIALAGDVEPTLTDGEGCYVLFTTEAAALAEIAECTALRLREGLADDLGERVIVVTLNGDGTFSPAVLPGVGTLAENYGPYVVVEN